MTVTVTTVTEGRAENAPLTNRRRTSRKAVAELVSAFRDLGLSGLEIARRTGYSRTYIADLITDPAGVNLALRRLRYTAECEGCGTTIYTSGEKREHYRCRTCSGKAQGEAKQKWPADLILERIKEWASIYGEPPAGTDWSPTACRDRHDEFRARRWEEANGYWPWFTLVINRFGTWNNAIRAAGFEPRPSGGGGNNWRRNRKNSGAFTAAPMPKGTTLPRPRRPKDPLKKQSRRSHVERLALAEQIRPYAERGAAWPDIGALFGISGSYAARLYHDPTGDTQYRRPAGRVARGGT